MIVYFVDWGT
jgi:hypothetical protein